MEILHGKGKIIGKGKLEVNGKIYAYKNLILASGAKWVKPDFRGSDAEGVITTDELLAREKLPKKILLYGNSPHLISIAQFLNRYGSDHLTFVQDGWIFSHHPGRLRGGVNIHQLRDTGTHLWGVKFFVRAGVEQDHGF